MNFDAMLVSPDGTTVARVRIAGTDKPSAMANVTQIHPGYTLLSLHTPGDSSRLSGYVATRKVGDTWLSAEVSPCSWIYADYGLNVSIQMQGGGTVYLLRKSLKFAQASNADVDSMLAEVKVCKCSRCGGAAFDPTSVETNRAGLCERCFVADCDAKYQKEQAKEACRLARRDAQKKQAGMTHCTEIWVHSSHGEGDYQVLLYTKKEPTPDLIRKEIEKAGGEAFGDYAVRKL